MQEITPIILTKEDFFALKQCIGPLSSQEFEGQVALVRALNEAIVVEETILPCSCVRLGAAIKIRSWPDNRLTELKIVLPGQASSNENKISVLDPLGSALIGLCKTEKIELTAKGVKRLYEIIDVSY
ncbi:GreA/GreB family elongation factor [Dyadobacter psychrotolerans]|uniref:GreA/GreB family elongation factor n=1 Tax=Dyadobacter psychrotolerans TaxID=2541721 RepID=A0A4R5DKX2_9BACT|nr:GreA/GreB family elongation factor [Dyadobacter psychrotolerans]TDE14846.1 GreA/GreB family elongation factor [Dyadobacter psychrotolerans]